MASALIALASFGLFGCCASLMVGARAQPDQSPRRAAPAARRPAAS